MKALWPIVLILLTLALPGFAKPMRAPSLEEAIDQSPVIVVAEYRGYQEDGEVSYFYGPFAAYRIRKVLKGAYPDEQVQIQYHFHDGSACLAEEGWTFAPALMPEPGSRWILFLRHQAARKDPHTEKITNATYRGSYGRMRWSETLEQTIRGKL